MNPEEFAAFLADIGCPYDSQAIESRDKISNQCFDWVNLAPGDFHVSDLCRDILNPFAKWDDGKKFIVQWCEQMVSPLGLLERVGTKRGWYRPRNKASRKMDLTQDTKFVELSLPMQLHQCARLYPGAVVIVSGLPNSGKTAFMLNCVQANMDHWSVHYFNSEMGPYELRARLEHFGRPIEDWSFSAYERSENFGDGVISGEGVLNIIDFLEVYDEFYKVGKMISDIHRNLKGAVAIIAMQQNPGKDTGLGGYRMLEKARLAVSLQGHTIKIVKAKDWKTHKNPNGMSRDFKLVKGCEFYPVTPWQERIE